MLVNVKRFSVPSTLCCVLAVFCTHAVKAVEYDKIYAENERVISNDGYWGKRGHIGGKEVQKVAPVKAEPEITPEPEVISYPEPDYSNISFGIVLHNNYEDYEYNSTTFDNNLGIDYLLSDVVGQDVVWQINAVRNDDGVFLANGIGVKPEDSIVGLGYNAFFDLDLEHGDTRFSFGGKYSDPTYIFNLSANAYVPTTSGNEEGDLAPSADIRIDGAISPTLSFHSAVEQYFGDRIRVGDRYDPVDDPQRFILGFDFTPVSLVQLGVEVNKVKDHDTGFGVYLFFNYDPWKTFNEQVMPLFDTDLVIRKLTQFSRTKTLARFAGE